MKIGKVFVVVLFSVLFIIFYIILNQPSVFNKISDKDSLIFLSPTFLYTYFLGFSAVFATIFTFSISILQAIIKTIDDKINDFSEKKELISKILSGFDEMKEDIMCFGIFFLIVLFFDFVKQIKYFLPWEFDVLNKCILPLEAAIFILSILIIYDIVKTVFNISDILIILMQIRKSKNETE